MEKLELGVREWGPECEVISLEDSGFRGTTDIERNRNKEISGTKN